jgi:lipopolysaccharide assembly protein A
MIIFLIVGLLVGAAGVVFAMQNLESVTVAFFTWQIEGSLALILIISMVAGALVSSLLYFSERVKKSFQISNLKNRVNELEEKLAVKEREVIKEKGEAVVNN